MTFIIEMIKNSPQWAVGISLIIIVISTQLTLHKRYKKFIALAIKNTEESGYLKRDVLPEEQMNPIKDYLKNIQVLCSTNARHFLIDNKAIDDSQVNKNVSYMTFNTKIKELLYQVVKHRMEKELKEMRNKFSMNTFKEFAFDEISFIFNDHKQRTIETIVNSAKDFMSETWIPLNDMTRKEGIATIDFRVIIDSLNKSFDSAILLQIEYFKRIRALEDAIK